MYEFVSVASQQELKGALKTPPLFPKTLLPVADHRGHLLGPALYVNQVRLKEVVQLLSYRYFLSGLTAGRGYSSGIVGPGSFQGSFEGPREGCESSGLGTCSAFECGSLLALHVLTNGNSNGSSNRLFSIHWTRLRLSLTFLLLFTPPQPRHWLLGMLCFLLSSPFLLTLLHFGGGVLTVEAHRLSQLHIVVLIFQIYQLWLCLVVKIEASLKIMAQLCTEWLISRLYAKPCTKFS